MSSMKKQSQGFTLIEMAIVLVVIGLILGAVMKGQDLINSARGKKFTSWVRSAESAQWAHLDRTGQFEGTAENLADEMDTLKNATLNLGGKQFDLSFSNDQNNQTIAVTTNSNGENVANYYKSFDTSIDGVANITNGSVFLDYNDDCNSRQSGWTWDGRKDHLHHNALCYDYAK